jgi:hypothetical protein
VQEYPYNQQRLDLGLCMGYSGTTVGFLANADHDEVDRLDE